MEKWKFQPEKWKFQKNEKRPGDFIILHTCTKNYDYMIYGSWDMVRDGRMDGRTDGKSGTQRWMPHLKIDEIVI